MIGFHIEIIICFDVVQIIILLHRLVLKILWNSTTEGWVMNALTSGGCHICVCQDNQHTSSPGRFTGRLTFRKPRRQKSVSRLIWEAV